MQTWILIHWYIARFQRAKICKTPRTRTERPVGDADDATALALVQHLRTIVETAEIHEYEWPRPYILPSNTVQISSDTLDQEYCLVLSRWQLSSLSMLISSAHDEPCATP